MAECGCLFARMLFTLLLLGSFLNFAECCDIPKENFETIENGLAEIKTLIGAIGTTGDRGGDYDEDSPALISGRIYNVSDTAITASSRYSAGIDPTCSRLDRVLPPGCKYPALGPSSVSPKEWIQVIMQRTFDIHAVATKGRHGYSQWLITYHIAAVREHGSSYIVRHGDAKGFLGNFDSSTLVRNVIRPPLRAKTVRLYIDDYHGWPCVRWELYGKPVVI